MNCTPFVRQYDILSNKWDMQMYSCGGYFKEPADSDSIASDSIQHIELEQPNENAVDPTAPVTPSPDGNQHGTPSQPKAAEEPKHTEI